MVFEYLELIHDVLKLIWEIFKAQNDLYPNLPYCAVYFFTFQSNKCCLRYYSSHAWKMAFICVLTVTILNLKVKYRSSWSKNMTTIYQLQIMQKPEMLNKNIKRWGFSGHFLLCLFTGEGHQIYTLSCVNTWFILWNFKQLLIVLFFTTS